MELQPRSISRGGRASRQKVKLNEIQLVPSPPPQRSSQPSRQIVAAPIMTMLPDSKTREAYGRFVAEIAGERKNFQSDVLFCETLMSKAATVDVEPQNIGHVKAAAASWALNILAENPKNKLFGNLRDALFPSLFISYSASNLGDVATYDQLRIPREDQVANPYLSHNFFASEYNEAKDLEEAFAQSKNHMLNLMQEKQKGTKHIMRKWHSQIVGTCFRSWRKLARTECVERFAREQRQKVFLRDSRMFMLQAVFSQWRYVVESARCVSLEEKVHSATYQLENAKNQFQLQCYRSDKYLRTVEDLRTELKELRDERDQFRDDGRELERKLRKFKEDARQDLNYHINNLLHIVNKWRGFSRNVIQEKLASSSVLSTVDENLASSARRQSVAQQPQSGSDEESDEDDDDGEALGEGEAAAQEETGHNPADEVTAEKALLRWCNSICRQSIVSQIEKVNNFTEDFQNGEVLLFLLHHVFPNSVPFSPLQENNIPKRLELICDIGKELGVAHLPKPSDMMECTGDYNVIVTAELFNRYCAKLRAENAAADQEGTGGEGGSDGDNAVKIRFDIDMMDTVLKEADQEMFSLKNTEKISVAQEKALLELSEAITRHAGYLTRERLYGNPVAVLDRKEVNKFCRFSKNRFKDISFKYKNPPSGSEWNAETWPSFEDQLQTLKKYLKKHFHTVRRAFKFYSGTNPTMSDNDFWRFCGDIRAMDKTFSRVTIDRIFTIANMDEIPDPEAEEEEKEEDDEEEENPATELIASEFVECLIRMADAKITGKTIYEKYDILLNNFVTPFACKNEMDKFKKDIYNASTQSSVQRYLKDFNRLFLHFAKAGSGKKKLMSLENFTFMTKEANLGSLINEDVASSVFKAVHGDDSTSEITMHEFLEVLVSCSVFKTSNPFVSLDKKVDIFSTMLISNLRAKLKGVVPLTDVKPVTLQQLMR